MKRLLIFSILIFSINLIHAQGSKPDEKIIYIIDDVPVLDDPDENTGDLQNEDIFELKILTSRKQIDSLGYLNFDKVVYVFTKEFHNRSEELRKIRTTKLMDRKNGVWYLKNSSEPYTGKFIDYFFSGKIQGEGELRNGIIEGVRSVYYQNGNKRYFYTYANGIQNGPSEEYFTNGKLKQKGSFTDKKETGLWQVFYSTGELKRQSDFVNNKPEIPKNELQFHNLLSKSVDFLREQNLTQAIKKLNEAEAINDKYSDLYFYRGTAKMELFDFDGAILDFDKAVQLEPLYKEALSNRAFARLRKYEFKNSKGISKTKEVTILASKDKVDIPKNDQDKICADLKKGFELGDKQAMIIDAMQRYCN